MPDDLPKAAVPAEDFAKFKNVSVDEIIAEIKRGVYRGRFDRGRWYVEVSDWPGKRSKPWADNDAVNRATAIMLAAANLDTRALYAEFKERRRHPFKADTEEPGLDIGVIEQEVRRAHTILVWRDIAMVCLMAVGLRFIWQGFFDEFAVEDPEVQNSVQAGLIAVICLLAIFDFVFVTAAKARARRLLKRAQDGADLAEPQSKYANVIVSGGYSPFVGAGFDVNGWSFTVNTLKAEAETRGVLPLEVNDLYRETEGDVRQLGIRELRMSDELFVDGRDVQNMPELLPTGPYAKPLSTLAPSYVNACLSTSAAACRHYKVLRAVLWGGQMVLSVYLKYMKVGGTLFVETRIMVLPPLRQQYTRYECIPAVALKWELSKDLLTAFIVSPIVWILPALRALSFFTGGFMELLRNDRRRNRKEIWANRKYNYGWSQSLREKWTSDSYERYFQMVDNDFYTKMIKEALLDSLLKSLQVRNISTEGLTEATTKIFNDGIILNGGTITAEAMAVGRGSAANASRTHRVAERLSNALTGSAPRTTA